MNDKNDGWQTVGGNSTGSALKLKDLGTVQGIYISKDENVGPNNSTIHKLRQPDGKELSFWGTALIDGRMEEIPFGEEVRIQYLGDETNPKTRRSYQNFQVDHRPANTAPASAAVPADDSDLPF